MDPIKAALTAIESLKPGEKLVYAQIARKYSVEPTTLARRHKGVSTSRSREAQNRQALHPQQELELLRYIQRLTRQGLPPTRAMIRNFASQITQREVGIHWVDRFVQRHPDELISKWTTSIDNNRHKADSAKKYSLYFDLLREKIEQYHVEARYIYNMDEKGFMLSAVGRSKRIFSRTSFETGKRRSTIQDGSREWITLLACICADGSYLEPALIYKSASSLIQNTWLQALDHETHQVRITSSPSSWTNNDIGLAWLKQVFDRSIKAKARSSYRLLILDGHGSHLTIDFIEYCDQNKILLAIYPPHSTHTLQPLDVVLFKPLSTAYLNEVSAFMERSQGLTSMSKRDFFPLFYRAWQASFKETTILKAFEATGLSPFNPTRQVILQRFAISPLSSDSESSALSASNWRKTEGLLRQVLKDRGDRRAQKLSQAFHRISTRKSLLEDEVKGLREALINERTRRKRGKPLLLQGPEEYQGGAVFWSPRKVKEARDRQQLQDHEAEQLQYQKAETNRLREEAKQTKAREVELRRQARAAARLVREKEKAEKAVKKASRAAAYITAKRLQKALKTSQKGKKRSLKALCKATTKKRAVVRPIGSGEPQGATIAHLVSTSRKGRVIKTPTRFL
ncbi:Pogo transposable element [Pyrenophora teres f. teres]|uniref:Pogo transposable element n=1 Tax=Pyrenophora teres f. teres TaxID=97479 RepID=A0A6S6VW63_9PLEO|nr:Pogo transposable element [Pyrenophora teres f. teres]CAE7016215.1 Pogo transposable element [Pyrenophora teres f. teres]